MNITEVLEKANISITTYEKEYNRLSGPLVPIRTPIENNESYMLRLLNWEKTRDIIHKQIIENFTIRASGRTTRQTDDYIQALFKGKIIHVFDHHGTADANLYLLDNILRRISIEHPHLKLEVDRTENKIELIK